MKNLSPINFGFLIGVLLAVMQPAVTETNAAPEIAAARDARMAWWREARFGMFIRFGLNAIPGRGEWVQWNEQIPVEEYAKFAGQFTLTNFSANAWTDVAAEKVAV